MKMKRSREEDDIESQDVMREALIKAFNVESALDAALAKYECEPLCVDKVGILHMNVYI